MSKITPLMRKKDLVIQELGKELFIYDLQNNKVVGLNETTALIWQTSDGVKTMSEIAQIVSKRAKAPIDEKYVWLAIWQLKKANLIENETEITDEFHGINRREVIRRIGLTTMVALPLVTTLIAPTALQAQSNNCGTAPNIALGCSCVVGGLANSGNCASQCCNFPQASFPGICVPRATVASGGSCIRSCQCISLICTGGVCS